MLRAEENALHDKTCEALLPVHMKRRVRELWIVGYPAIVRMQSSSQMHYKIQNHSAILA